MLSAIHVLEAPVSIDQRTCDRDRDWLSLGVEYSLELLGDCPISEHDRSGMIQVVRPGRSLDRVG